MAKRDYQNWSKEELIREVQKLEKRKKYGIVWDEEKNPEKVVLECREKLPVLIEEKNKEIITNEDKPINILIEGDNYHAISVLNYTHKGKIDVIYIDPPYNTGNKDFIYNDRYIDEEDAYRHSKWLSFMYKRLLLAKHLLRGTGVIFISIDDNEFAPLKLLMDDSALFGENNFVNIFVWNKKNVVQNDAKFASVNHEYIIAYAKHKTMLGKFNLLPRTEELNARYDNPDDDPRGPWTSVALQAKSGSESNVYEIKFPNGKKWKPVPGTYPRLTKESLIKAYKEGRLWFGKNGKNVPRLKKYLSEVKQGVVSNSILLPDDVGSTQLAKELLKKILNKNVFETPKPAALIKRLIMLAGNSNATVMDFMAGSGTTGQAVLELNKEDDGTRKFILCTNNENDICTEVCYPRIKKVIMGYKNPNGEKIKGTNGNLKYFKTDFVNAEPTDRNKKKLVDKSTEMLCLKEDCYDEVKKGKDFRIFKNNQNKYLGIVYDDDGIEPFKKEAKRLKKKFVVYVFSLDESAREEEFEDMSDMLQLKPIPAVILNVYKRIFK
ncbi:MAG: site-specific DNA-methyltransferase [Candidatus Omnitrophica bacterium]|nr:site-specific DNA-methyltransferase [Candidatus Omnitrophota bacterium]